MLRFGVGGGGTARCACTVRSGCQWELASIARAVKAPHRIVAFEPPVTPGGGHWGNLPPSRFRSFGFTRGHGRHGVWFEIVLRFHFCKHYTTSDQLVLPRFLQVAWHVAKNPHYFPRPYLAPMLMLARPPALPREPTLSRTCVIMVSVGE